MFYSQFILAKKGPLGTIWIAAHLERKLKKNQVADTDIGVSVDSILFPEVPIALRLSSHLLLGVVRIYSRKVNYLFHDCSEALLKVKQAFRSTAVDLPPEESTAPYHSITLPETFDLDDFELPDSALLSGNFDDRHVSTREQITLQDTLDGTGYSTSQFGLDERFGDGDASQIGLDLDEELLLDNNLTLQDASVLDGAACQGRGATILAKMVIEEGQHGCDDDRTHEASKELSELLGNNRDKHVVSNENVNRNDDSSRRLIFNIQTPDLNEVFLPDDHIGGPSAAHDIDMDFPTADSPFPECDKSANFPSTPGLMEEAIRANFQELPDSNPQKISTDLEVDTHDKPINQEAENLDATNVLTNAASTKPKSANLAQIVSSPTSVLAEPKPDSVVPVNDDDHKHDESKGVQSANTVPVVSSSTSVLTETNASPAAESLGGTLAGPDVANNINFQPVESTDPKLSDISQVLPSSTLILTEPVSGSLVPQYSRDTITASGIDGIPPENITKLSNLNQDRVGDLNTCQTGNYSALISDFHLRSCTSESNQANLVSPCAMIQERTREFSFSGQPCHLETPMVGQKMHFSGSSMDPQGLCSAIATDTNIRVGQKSDNIPAELSSNCISKDVQLGNCNYFLSSEFSEPERMRFSVSGNVNFSNYLGQQTTEKANLVSPCPMIQERSREFSFSGQPCHSETPMVGQKMHFSGSSMDPQGLCSAMATDTNIRVGQKSDNIPVELSSNCISKDGQLGNCNYFSNSEFSEAERMRFTVSGNVNFSNYLGQQTTEKANLVSPCALIQERTREFSFSGQPCHLETPMVGQKMHISGSSLDPQGLCPAIATDTNIRVGQKSDNIPVELSSNCISKDVQLGNCNYFLSSEFSEAERMRFTVSGNVNFSNYLGQQTTEKGVTESDGSVDRISNLSGQKRCLIDITPDLQNAISPKMCGIPQKKRNNDYIPNDDDLLASILVGRMTPALRIGSTPPLPKPPSLKRPRLTAKAGLLKRRKVLLDDTIVLHADAIRQQLINTEDIRRMRKKAPCTRPEIWRIQKSSLDDIFCESIFTDMNTLLTRRYDLTQNVHSQISGHRSSGEAAIEVELSKSSIFFRDADDREMVGQNAVEPKTVDGEMQGPLGTSKLIEAESCKNALSVDAHERLESALDLRHDDLQGTTISRAELDTLEHSGVEMATHSNQEQNSLNKVFQISHELAEVNNNSQHVANDTSFENFTSADCAAGSRVDTSLQVEDFSNAKAASITVDDMSVDIVNVNNLDCPHDGAANVGKDDNGGASVSMLDRFIVEVGADFPSDSPSVTGYANASVPYIALVGGGPVTSDHQAMDPKTGKVTSGCETVVDDERPLSEVPGGERPDVASFSILPSAESEHVPSAVGENSSTNIEGGVDVESTSMEFAATRESSDFCSAIDDIDTDFLNVDDEVEYEEETNNDVPYTEEAQSLENSGWSSRTRGVARYLKNMFDQESGRGRKSLAIDHLLAGKSRKEASRMFFETLVLKTRDYIHVEQENPFDCVDIKPRIKLLKSEF